MYEHRAFRGDVEGRAFHYGWDRDGGDGTPRVRFALVSRMPSDLEPDDPRDRAGLPRLGLSLAGDDVREAARRLPSTVASHAAALALPGASDVDRLRTALDLALEALTGEPSTDLERLAAAARTVERALDGPEARRRRRLEEVAAAYRDAVAVGAATGAHVAAVLGVSAKTARNLVTEARAAGLLEPAGPGRRRTR